MGECKHGMQRFYWSDLCFKDDIKIRGLCNIALGPHEPETPKFLSPIHCSVDPDLYSETIYPWWVSQLSCVHSLSIIGTSCSLVLEWTSHVGIETTPCIWNGTYIMVINVSWYHTQGILHVHDHSFNQFFGLNFLACFYIMTGLMWLRWKWNTCDGQFFRGHIL